MKKIKKAFTLVELIVVIIILSILGTISFISLQGYSKDARDSTRISDIGSIKSSLELFQVDSGKYPETTDYFTVTYSGVVLWTQGYFGESTFKNVDKLDKIPTDPLTNQQYIYSVTNTKNEYELAGIIEGELTGNTPMNFSIANANEKKARLKISGNYNGTVLKATTGSTTYVLAVPSLITSSGITLQEIIENKYLAYNGYRNLPSQYHGIGYNILGEDGLNLVNINDIVVYNGDINILSQESDLGINSRALLVTKLQKAYSGTEISNQGEIAEIIETPISDMKKVEYLSSVIVRNNLGGNIMVKTMDGLVGGYSCGTQPNYTNASYEEGVPLQVNQPRQSSDSTQACYWTCGEGKVLLGNDCVSENCVGETPDGTTSLGNATSTAGGTWHYSTTPGVCTYECNTNYTWNGSNCTDQTPPIISNISTSSPSCETITYTITASDEIGLDSNPYSFDGGSTWQSGNTKNYSGTSLTKNSTDFKVKDLAGNITTYSSNVSGTSSSCYTYSWYSSSRGTCSATSYWGSRGSCSVSCGGGTMYRYCQQPSGTQTRTVYCQRSDGASVSDSYCTGTKPTTSTSCTADLSGCSRLSSQSASCNTQSCCFNYNFVAGTISACNSSIYSTFGYQKATCTIGGGCGGANPTLPGACVSSC